MKRNNLHCPDQSAYKKYWNIADQDLESIFWSQQMRGRRQLVYGRIDDVSRRIFGRRIDLDRSQNF